VQFLEQTEVVRGILGRLARMVVRRRRGTRDGRAGWRDGQGPIRADLIRVDPDLAQPLAVLLDTEAALGEPVRAPPPQWPLLHEVAVRDDAPDRDEERGEREPRRGLAPADRVDDPRAADEAD
jgi:hypothetical protein